MSCRKENKRMYQNDRLAVPQTNQTELASTMIELNDEQLATVAGGDGYSPNGGSYGAPDNDADDSNQDGYPGYPGYYGYPGGYGYPGPFGYGGLGVLLPLLGL